MSGRFKPCMSVLPVGQKRLWPALHRAPELGFTLYGGTAIALRLGHRASVDFDFFSTKPLDREAIKFALPFVAESTTLEDHDNAWSLLVPCGDADRDHVKLSFFGAIAFGRVGNPDFTDDGVLEVASLEDLMATKLKVILQRAEAKDYRDIVAMVGAGLDLAHGLASARLLFGMNFQPGESLKALVYFNDGDLNTLAAAQKQVLIDSVKAIRALPDVALRSTCLRGIG